MPKGTNNEDHFKFLISCIRYSNNGKIDFEKVAEECEIVTKGAAAKRYERMMKAHGIHQPQGPTGRDTGVQPLKSASKGKGSAPPAKKRKRVSAKDDDYVATKTKESDEEDEEHAVKTEMDDTEIRLEQHQSMENNHKNNKALQTPTSPDEDSIGGYDGAFDTSMKIVIKTENDENDG